VLTEDQIKILIASAGESILEHVAKGVEPLQEAMRGMQLELLALRLATYQLAAIVASRFPDGMMMLRAWLESTIQMVDTVSLNDEKDQALSPELEAQIRAEVKKRLEALTPHIFEQKP
jgi:hypothetical protein